MLRCLTQCGGDKIKLQPKRYGSTLRCAGGAHGPQEHPSLYNPVPESDLRGIAFPVGRYSYYQRRFPASGLVCAQSRTSFLEPSPGCTSSPAKVVWPAQPARSSVMFSFSNSNNGGEVSARNAGSGRSFRNDARERRGSSGGLPTCSRKKLSNLGRISERRQSLGGGAGGRPARGGLGVRAESGVQRGLGRCLVAAAGSTSVGTDAYLGYYAGDERRPGGEAAATALSPVTPPGTGRGMAS